jgi:hypothetical protein
MSTFTGRDLEFLAGLNKSWWRLYWKELSHLRGIEGAASQQPAARTPAFEPEFCACGEDTECPFQWRNAPAAGQRVAAPR